MSEDRELNEINDDEKMFRGGHPVASRKLEDVNMWNVPRITENEAHIFQNAFNHTFEVSDIEEEVSSAPPTIAEVESIRKEAYREGMNEGREKGYQEGHAEGKALGLEEGKTQGMTVGQSEGMQKGLEQAQEHIEQFLKLMKQLEEPLHNVNEDTEQQLLQLVSLLAKGVIMNELKTHPEQILSVIHLGIEALPAKRQKITLRLNPEDVKLVEQLMEPEKLKEMQCTLEADKLLARGELKINTDYSHVDLTLEKRIQKVFEELDALKGDENLSRGLSAPDEQNTDIQEKLADAEEDLNVTEDQAATEVHPAEEEEPHASPDTTE